MQLYRGSITAERVIAFLRALLRLVPGQIIVVWDNIGIHRAKVLKAWLGRQSRIQVEYLPAYAPELNPDEGFWAYLKYKELANYCAQDLDQLEEKIRRARRNLGRKKHIVRGFYKRTALAQC